MLSSKLSKKLISMSAAAAMVAGAMLVTSPGSAMADPYHFGDRHEVAERHDTGRHPGWDSNGRDFNRDDVRYTVVCDRDGDTCRTVPRYVAPGWRLFDPGTWFRR